MFPPTDFFWPYEVMDSPTNLSIHHRGPPLTEGPLPALFYFALSGEESLTLDPFNQPIVFLGNERMRVFSFTLPGHGPGYEERQAMQVWSQKIAEGEDFVNLFIEAALQNINFLISQGFVDERHLGAAGLSRGGFMAAHLAAKEQRIQTILGFAPMTQLEYLRDFKENGNPNLLSKLSLSALVNELADKHLRFYIGNRDLRVGTTCCFNFINELTETAYERGSRSPPIELIIFPSIGYKGHGTPPNLFQDGANWLKSKLLS